MVALEGAWEVVNVFRGDEPPACSATLQGQRLGLFVGWRDLPASWRGFEAAEGTPRLLGLDVSAARWQADNGPATWGFGFGFKGAYRVMW